mmetsp:Transcript_32833/g.67207  ORF Transcript_32833/g.67207 Transcript_32833/m.67207 type:complete len:347 (-) Transcript_32833:66-1106(-)
MMVVVPSFNWNDGRKSNLPRVGFAAAAVVSVASFFSPLLLSSPDTLNDVFFEAVLPPPLYFDSFFNALPPLLALPIDLTEVFASPPDASSSDPSSPITCVTILDESLFIVDELNCTADRLPGLIGGGSSLSILFLRAPVFFDSLLSVNESRNFSPPIPPPPLKSTSLSSSELELDDFLIPSLTSSDDSSVDRRCFSLCFAFFFLTFSFLPPSAVVVLTVVVLVVSSLSVSLPSPVEDLRFFLFFFNFKVVVVLPFSSNNASLLLLLLVVPLSVGVEEVDLSRREERVDFLEESFDLLVGESSFMSAAILIFLLLKKWLLSSLFIIGVNICVLMSSRPSRSCLLEPI